MNNFFEDKLLDAQKVIETCLGDVVFLNSVQLAAEICCETIKGGGKIMFAGNGGSAADSQHLAAEFVSRFRFDRKPMPAIALTTDSSCLTAIGNDYGFDQLFSRQLEAIYRPGDTFVGITTSGNSQNILHALNEAKLLGLKTIMFTGNKSLDSRLFEMLNCAVQVPSATTASIQEIHIQVGHYICGFVEDNLFEK